MLLMQEEKEKVLQELGLSEEEARFMIKEDTEFRAVLPAYRLLKPLNDSLKFYQGEYKNMIERMKEEGRISRMPVVQRLLESGALAEDIEKLAYEMTLSAYETLLYRLDDREGAEYNPDMQETYQKCGYWKLMEIGEDGEPTGRYLIELHGKLPMR